MIMIRFNLPIYHYNSWFGLVFKDFDGADHIEWFSCRDSFRNRWGYRDSFDRSRSPSVNKMYFLMNGGENPKLKFKQLERMLKKLQDSMNLKAKQRVSIQNTSHDNCIFIHVSKFWRVKYRMDFLTAFLRNCEEGVRKSYDRIIKKGKYFSATQQAVKMFVNGKTKLKTKKFIGWVNTFSDKSKSVVKSMLE